MPDPALRTLPDARWACRGCGNCCRLFQLGPVEPEIIAGLEKADIASRWPAASERPWHREQPGPDGAPAAFLTAVDGACIFLRPDNRCAVHALLGAAAKPGFCREYPVSLVEDPQGVVAVARPDCGGLHESFEDGESLAPQAEEVRALRARPRRFAPSSVPVLPDLSVPLPVWMDWEQHLLALLESRDWPSPEAAVAAARAELYSLARSSEPEPDPVRYVIALRAAVEGLYRVLCAQAASPAPPTISTYELDFVANQTAALGRVRQRLTDWSALDAPLAPEARRYLSLLLRGHLLGKQVHSHGGVAEGLGAWLLDTVIGRLGGPELAEDADEGGEVQLETLGPAMSGWRKLSANGTVQRVLRLARPALRDAFQHAG